MSDYDQLADIVLVPKDGGNVIRPELWAEAERLVEAIALIEVTDNFFLASAHHHLGLFLRAERLLRLHIVLDPDPHRFLSAVSGSMRAKMKHKNLKLKASPVAWTSFIEALG